jgi:hypothetical protein
MADLFAIKHEEENVRNTKDYIVAARIKRAYRDTNDIPYPKYKPRVDDRFDQSSSLYAYRWVHGDPKFLKMSAYATRVAGNIVSSTPPLFA